MDIQAAWDECLQHIPMMSQVFSGTRHIFESSLQNFAYNVYGNLVTGDYVAPQSGSFQKVYDALKSPKFEQLKIVCGNDKRVSMLATNNLVYRISQSIRGNIKDYENTSKNWGTNEKIRVQFVDDNQSSLLEGIIQPENWIGDALQRTLDTLNPMLDDRYGFYSQLPSVADARSVKDKVELGMVYSDSRCQAILKELGRLENIFGSRKTKKPIPRTGAGYVYGNNIPDLMVDEYSKNDDLFYLEYAEEKLVQRKPQTKKVGTGGALVVLLDQSGSMLGDIETGYFQHEFIQYGYDLECFKQRDIWAKALLMLIYKRAVAEKRDIYCLGYNTSVIYSIQLNKATSTQINTIFNREISPYDKTEIDRTIDGTISLIKSNKKFNNADVILLSDGGIDYSNRKLQALKTAQKSLGFKVEGILLGAADYEHSMNKLCDKTTVVSALSDEKKLHSTLYAI